MWKFIKYEWKYWLRAPMTWIFLGIVTLLVFGAVSSENIVIGGGTGSTHKNAPQTIQMLYGLMSLMCLLMTTAFMNATASRDFQHNMYQLVFSSPVKKSHYFFGKFIGAVTIAAIPLLGVSIGALLGPVMPWVQPERYGPVIWDGHIWGLLSFAIPNIFITGVILFSLALIFRNTIVSFVGAMLILVFYAISSGLTQDIEKEWLANILDPFGFRPMNILSKYMTVDEKNTMATPLTGSFLWNRIIWIGFSFLLLLGMYFRFSFNTRKQKASVKKKIEDAVGATSLPPVRTYFPKHAGTVTAGLLARMTKFELKAIIKNPTFIIISLIGAINLIASLTSFTGRYGASQYPVTYDVIDTIQGSFYIFLIAIITFYSGVLVWRDRDARIAEIQDASPVRTGALFISKFLAMLLTLALIMAGLMAIGMLAQLAHGYTRLQPEVYIQSLLVMDLLGIAYMIVIALFFHYLINYRYIAYFAFIAFIVVNAFIWTALEVETNMVDFGATPSVIYSDMNGFGPFILSVTWFNIYWSLFTLILGFVVFAFYIRGRETSFGWCVRNAWRLLGKNALATGIATVCFILCSGFVYYNTKVLNTYHSSEEYELMAVDYEKKYKHLKGKVQPRWYRLNYKLDIYPEDRNLIATTEAWIRNISSESIEEIHFNLPSEADSMEILIPGSKVIHNDERLEFRTVRLDQPLRPGDSLMVTVHFRKETRGFENEVSFTSLTQNGTFFNNQQIMPTMGYDPNRELHDKHDRKKYELPVRRRSPTLDETNLDARGNNYVISDADWVTVNTVISTSPDQTAVAPGSLVRSWEEDGRKYFNYSLDHPSLNFYSFISAKYEVARKEWKGISLEVYYQKDHAYNVPNMLKSIEQSLKYYTENFGPYKHKQARIIEFPRYASFAQAFPGTMPYSEGIGFITDLRDVSGEDIDFVFYVVAHEMAHQYWAHQLCGADMQGSELMSEGFSQYAALMVMEKEYGRDKMKKFLKYEMDGYLRGRSMEFEAERPLIKTEGQGYIHYQKASVALYYLKEMIGESAVNSALRSLLDSFAYREPPYPTALSALRAFRAVTPDTLQYLITDLFEQITVFSNRVVEANATKKGEGWEVIVRTTSEKYYADTLGKETAAVLDDYVDLAVFGEQKDKDHPAKPLIRQRVRLQSRDTSFTFFVKERPSQAGIDPYNYLVDRIPDDNMKRISHSDGS